MHSVMITIEVDFDNPVSQDFYNKIIFSLNLSQIPCTCGLAGSLIWYGGYHRKVRMADHIILLRVARVFCTACGHTHALLLSSLVPYSQIPLPVQASVADCYEKSPVTTVSLTPSHVLTKIPFLLLSVLTGSTGSSAFVPIIFPLRCSIILSADVLHPFPGLSCR